MRIAAIVLAALAVAGCASRQSASTELGQTAPPVNYENTVTSYFDLTTRTPLAQRKLQFGAPESTRCRILGSVGGHTGWVVPVTYEVTAPTAGAPPPHSTMSPGLAAAAATAPKPVPVAKGKPAKGKKAAADKNNATPATGAPQTALAALFVQTTPADVPAVALENVSVTGKTRYFFWFDRETINAVTKRMDICP